MNTPTPSTTTLRKEAREVLDQARSLGTALEKERKRHHTTNEKCMVQAANNVYSAHLLGLIDPNGYVPPHGGAAGKSEAREAAKEGVILTAKAYAMILGYSEAYISRLYRLGFALAAGVVDPEETREDNQPTRWQLLSRSLGDTPEIGAVLGKDVGVLPTEETMQAAIEAAQERKSRERAEAARRRHEEPEGPIPTRPSEQIDLLEDLIGTIKAGRRLTNRQIARVQGAMDEIREMIEDWMQSAEGQREQAAAGVH